MRLQVKIEWVGAPIQNSTQNGTFWNQDVVAQLLDSNDRVVLRVTSGQRADNINNFHIRQGETMEIGGYFNVSWGKENRPFMQFNCNEIQRDRSLWGTTGSHSNTIDLSKVPASYNGYTQPQYTQQPQQRPVYTQQPAQPTVPQGIMPPPVGMTVPQGAQPAQQNPFGQQVPY